MLQLLYATEQYDQYKQAIVMASTTGVTATTDPFTWQITGGMPEYNIYWGTYLTDVVDGTASVVSLTEGTVTVEHDGVNYTITLRSGNYNLCYSGPLDPLAAPAN